MDSPKWFVVALLYESIHKGKPKQVDENYDSLTKTYEESHILVKATSTEEALLLGRKTGEENEHDYENQYGERVFWKLIKILDCFELLDENLKTGTEVYSRYILVQEEVTNEEVLKRFFQD